MLSDLQIAALLEEIASAMRAKLPVGDSMARLETNRVGAVGKAARSIREHLQRGESLGHAIGGISSRASKQAAAALEACEQSHHPQLIERIAARLRQRAEMTTNGRLAWFYPWMLLVLGYFVATFSMAPMIRDMQGRDIHWPEWLQRIANSLQPIDGAWIVPALVLGALLVVLMWFCGRDRFQKSARLSLFCSSLADQLANDVPETKAIDVSSRIAALPELEQGATLRSPFIQKVLGPATAADEVAALDVKGDMLVARLRYLGAMHSENARYQAYVWTRLLPRCGMILVGGGLTLAYAWWVLAPVYYQVSHWQ